MDHERDMTFDDVLRMLGAAEARASFERADAELAAEYGELGDAGGGCGCGGGSGSGCGASAGALRSAAGACGCGSGAPAGATARCGCGCASLPGSASGNACGCGGAAHAPHAVQSGGTVLDKPVDRRGALGMLFGAAAVSAQLAGACSPLSGATEDERERKLLEWEEHFKGNFRVMSDADKARTIGRLERLAQLRTGTDVAIAGTSAQPGVEYGYAFNISKCKGYRNCVEACINENNLDRSAGTQYIRIFEMKRGVVDLDHADATYQHAVPAEGHFYLGTQCFQCANPPCVPVCPVRATWQEPDGIVVVDYDWCIGCRYCMAACPYWARRFNWGEPVVPAAELNPNQHYLGNRARKKGVVEKCTFCIQRTRAGRLPACADACPTGARVFGNLLDPDSEIRWVLANKQVFRLKEELHTEPRFWYFMD
jgi:Fe-S-cluster-containing dehydrogenase component